MSTAPTCPSKEPPVDEETRRIVEQRLLTADHEPTHHPRAAVEEIRARRKTRAPVPALKVVLTSSAKADLDRAAGWYESQKEGLGNRFLAAFLDTLDRVGRNPEGYAKVIRETRKANLEGFPYQP